jgi:hypothetical protein
MEWFLVTHRMRLRDVVPSNAQDIFTFSFTWHTRSVNKPVCDFISRGESEMEWH